MWVELGLALYALAGTVIAWKHYPALVLYLAISAIGFGLVAAWSLHDTWLIAQHRARVFQEKS